MIDESTRRRIAEIMAHARAHPIAPMASPGESHALYLDRHIVVYDHELGTRGRVYRHLSVTNEDGGYPAPGMVRAMMDAFGFPKPAFAYMRLGGPRLRAAHIFELITGPVLQ